MGEEVTEFASILTLQDIQIDLIPLIMFDRRRAIL